MSVLLVFGLIIATIWVQWRAITRWDGVWRWLAAAPLALLGADLVSILIETSIDPTARNLWPLELLLIGAAGLPAVGCLWLARRILRAWSRA